MFEYALETDGLTKRLGRRTVLDRVNLGAEAGPDLRPDRAKRRREDHPASADRRAFLRHGRRNPPFWPAGRGRPAQGAQTAGHHDRGAQHQPVHDRGGKRRAAPDDPRHSEPGAGPAAFGAGRAVGRREEEGQALFPRDEAAAGIAQALVGNPELLALDEPINGLDPMGIAQVRRLLQTLCEERGMTLLLSSHNLPELYQTATDYIIIDRGVIRRTVTLKALEEQCGSTWSIRADDPARAVGLDRARNGDRSLPRHAGQVHTALRLQPSRRGGGEALSGARPFDHEAFRGGDHPGGLLSGDDRRRTRCIT